MANWLVTGGAGYIGAHVVRELESAGVGVVVVDDLSTGRVERLPPTVRFVLGSVLNKSLLVHALEDVEGVIHLAAKKSVPESLERPLVYYEENVAGLRNLLESMEQAKVSKLVLSSSAAVYGQPREELVKEDSATVPTNPYGFTKFVCERMIQDVGAATGLRWVALRYFNVAGAASPSLADVEVSNLIPIVLAALSQGRRPEIFGSDYPTPDGTCERDFIHVADLAEAHIVAVNWLTAGAQGGVFNVGRGEGASVKTVVEMARRISGIEQPPMVRARRAGDAARVVADPSRIQRELGWRARRGLEEMIESAWRTGPRDSTASPVLALEAL